MAELAPVAFLRRIPPFDALPPPAFETAARSLEVAYFPAGQELVRAGGPPLRALHVLRTGSARILRGRRTVEIVEPGETFGYTSLLTGVASYDVLVDEDALAYLVPAAAFQALLANAAFAAHFAGSLTRRLRRTLERASAPAFQPDLSREVGSLLRRPPIWVREDASVGDAARAMRDARSSSVLVASDPPAIVTDRDLRNRVLAERRGSALPVAAVASRPLRTLDAHAPLHAAWAAMLDSGVNHLPLVRDGVLAGVVTSTDLLRATAAGPLSLVSEIERLSSRDELPGHAERLAELADALLAGGLDPASIGPFAARLDEALLARVVAWAEDALGPAPAPWALVALGADGRMERPLGTVRDLALVVADGAGPPARGWFGRLAASLVRDLEAAGFPPARVGSSLTARTMSGWREAAVLARAEPTSAGALLDLRRVAGGLDLAPLLDDLGGLAADPGFRQELRRAALAVSPDAKLGDAPVDLEVAGIEPVARLARVEALACGAEGLAARTTMERLAVVARARRLSPDRHAAVADAFRSLLGLRLGVQLRRLAEGREPLPVVEPATLDAGERARLKDALRAVRGWQEKVRERGRELA